MTTARHTIERAPCGTLCVTYSDTLFSEPVRVTHYWPIVEQGIDPDEVEAVESRGTPGAYSVRTKTPRHSGGYLTHWTPVRLVDGERTQPIHSTHAPEPKPRTRVECYYKDGRWWKRLKSGDKPA